MHSAVMQNKKYIEFAKDYTVEVLALGRLDEGVKKHDKRAVAFKAKDASGKDVEYMLEWPNLTYQEILDLDRSKAATYNKTGKIPYTSIVNPHTLDEMKSLPGGQGQKSIQEAVEEARAALTKSHGKGMTRKELSKVEAAEATVESQIAAMDFAKAADALDKIKDPPPALKERLDTARSKITTAAQAKLDSFAELAKTDAPKAMKELSAALPKFRGTGLEEKAKDLLKSFQTGN